MIKLVTIDLWNTIIDSSGGKERKAYRNGKLIEALAAAGREVQEGDIDEAFLIASSAFDRRWVEDHKTMNSTEMITHICEQMGVEMHDGTLKRIIDAFEDSIFIGKPQLLPGAKETLAELSAKYPLAIISDTALSPGTMLRKLLEEHGVLQYFSHFSFSDETGAAKPGKRAFDVAFEPFDAQPEEAVHIGDIERTDVAGAKNYGMHAILFRGDKNSISYKNYRGETDADAIAESWQEIPGIIMRLAGV